MDQSTSSRERGFTLVELLVAMALSGVLMAAIGSTFWMQRKSYATQEQIAEMVQSTRAAMDMVSHEVKMAGYDPARLMQRINPESADFVGVAYHSDELRIVADLNGNGVNNDTNENITYRHDAANSQIDRKIGAGGNQPFAENIQAFNFEYLDGSGNPTTTTGEIRQIRITVTGRTARADPGYPLNGGHRTCTLTSVVTPRNLAL